MLKRNKKKRTEREVQEDGYQLTRYEQVNFLHQGRISRHLALVQSGIAGRRVLDPQSPIRWVSRKMHPRVRSSTYSGYAPDGEIFTERRADDEIAREENRVSVHVYTIILHID